MAKVIKEFGFLSQDEYGTSCAELTRAMYGNIDSPLQWMKTFSNILKGDTMKMQQSATEPCIFYKQKGGKVINILVLYVDDTLCAGEKKEVESAYKKIEEKIKIVRFGILKKHLGIMMYDWKQDKAGNTYLEAYMTKMIEEISDKLEKVVGKKAKVYAPPGTPGMTLVKNTGPMVELDACRSIVGKIMYYATKIAPDICNAVRKLAEHVSNPGTEHRKALEQCVGYMTDTGTQPLCLRKPRVLQSISDCDADYAKDEDDIRTDQHARRNYHQLDIQETTNSVIE
jgi:Reverse transcriptase (RNA-dependent DNA polymerase)